RLRQRAAAVETQGDRDLSRRRARFRHAYSQPHSGLRRLRQGSATVSLRAACRPSGAEGGTGLAGSAGTRDRRTRGAAHAGDPSPPDAREDGGADRRAEEEPTPPALAAQLNREFVANGLLELTATDWREKLKKEYTDPLTVIGGQQDEMVGEC